MTAKSPSAGKDIIQSSANNFYFGVTLADLKNFTERYRLNSRVVKENGKLVEQVYRAGTPDGRVPPGLYAQYLKKANESLDKARAYAEPRAGQSDCGSDSLLPDRGIQGLAAVRHRLGAGQRAGRFRKRFYRGLSRCARGKRNLAELRLDHGPEGVERHRQDRGECAVFRGPRAVGCALQEAGREAPDRQRRRNDH